MILKAKKFEIERQFLIDGIYTAFSFKWDDSFVFQGESHDFWEIVFIRSGEVEVVEDDRIYTLGKNNMILHAPLEFHRIRSKNGKEPEGFVMTFNVNGDLPKELKQGIFILTDAQSEEYTSICQCAKSFVEREAATEYLGQQIADSLSLFLVRLSVATLNRSIVDSPSATEYRKIVSDMSERVCQNITLCELAVINNVSVSYIKLLFKKYAGISPKAYFTHLRVQHAVKLLREKYTITEVAEIMNFSSPNYFSVFFKKHVGVSPLEYKYQLQANIGNSEEKR